MKKGLLITVAALTAAAGVSAVWQYEGRWPTPAHKKLLWYGSGVAARGDDEFYVAEGYTNNSRIWWVKGTEATWWGGYGSEAGEFKSPSGIALAPNGNVYVLDAGNYRVQYFTPNGSFLGLWATTGETQHLGAGDIAVAPNGNVYVTHAFGKYVSYYTSTGSLLGTWGAPGNGAGEFNNPQSIAVSPSSVVYVGDVNNQNIQYFTSAGSFLGSWGGGSVIWPCGLAVSPDGRVFVADAYYNRVKYFTATGSFLGEWGSQGKQEGQFNYANAVAISPSGRIAFVSDRDNKRVQWFREQLTPATPSSLGRVKALYR